MKKILALLLTLCTCFSLAAGLSSCKEEHVHEYSEFWTFDDESHWHDCIGNCGSSIDKAPHAWDEGTITQEADEETTGSRRYVCKVCGKEKIETFEYDSSLGATTTVREDQMKRAFDRERFRNVTMTFYSTDSGKFARKTVYLFTEKGTYWYQLDERGKKFDEQYYIYTDGGYEVYTKGEDGNWYIVRMTAQRFATKYVDFASRFSAQYAVFANNYSKFVYSEDDKEYQLFEETVAGNNLTYAILRFKAKRLTFLGFLRPIGESLDFASENYGNYQEFSFTDYGTTSFEIPAGAIPKR